MTSFGSLPEKEMKQGLHKFGAIQVNFTAKNSREKTQIVFTVFYNYRIFYISVINPIGIWTPAMDMVLYGSRNYHWPYNIDGMVM